MFGTLLESRAARQRRTGGSLASLLIHTAIIGGVTVLTARETISAETPEERVKVVVFKLPPPKADPAPLTSRPLNTGTTTTAPRPVILTVPLTVPTEIPLPDLSAPPTDPNDYRGDRPIGAGICVRDCAPPGQVGGNGEELWTPNDVMMRLRETPVAPRYPEALRRAGVEGTVVVKFAVDTTGRVDMGTIEVVRSTHDAFTVAVREALARLRFDPSRMGDRKVRALAVMPFQFTLK